MHFLNFECFLSIILHSLTWKILLSTLHFSHDKESPPCYDIVHTVYIIYCIPTASPSYSVLPSRWRFSEYSRLSLWINLRGTKKIKQDSFLIIPQVVLVDGGGKWIVLGKMTEGKNRNDSCSLTHPTSSLPLNAPICSPFGKQRWPDANSCLQFAGMQSRCNCIYQVLSWVPCVHTCIITFNVHIPPWRMSNLTVTLQMRRLSLRKIKQIFPSYTWQIWVILEFTPRVSDTR